MTLRIRHRRALHHALQRKNARRRAHLPWRLRLARDVGDIAARYTTEGDAFEEEVLDEIAREAARRADTVRLRTQLARDPYGELSPDLAKALSRRVRCEAPRDILLARDEQRVESVLALEPSGSRLRIVYDASRGLVQWCVELDASTTILRLEHCVGEGPNASSSLHLDRKFHRRLGSALGLSLARHEALFFLLSMASTYDNAHDINDAILEQVGYFEDD